MSWGVFWGKKILSRILFPIPLVGVLLGGGVLLWLLAPVGSSWRRRGQILTIVGVLLFGFFACFGWQMLWTLTNMYSSLNCRMFQHEKKFCIAVAGSGFYAYKDYRPRFRFNETMTIRMWEAACVASELRNAGKEVRMVISIYKQNIRDGIKEETVRDFLRFTAVPDLEFELLENARNSREEVIAFQKICREDEVPILVSSASHIPRLMLLAERFQFSPWPAPAGDRRDRYCSGWPSPNFPSGLNMAASREAIYEYLGLVDACYFGE